MFNGCIWLDYKQYEDVESYIIHFLKVTWKRIMYFAHLVDCLFSLGFEIITQFLGTMQKISMEKTFIKLSIITYWGMFYIFSFESKYFNAQQNACEKSSQPYKLFYLDYSTFLILIYFLYFIFAR